MHGVRRHDGEHRDGAALDAKALAAELRQCVRGEVRFDAGSRGVYSTDASNYRQPPVGVVVPYDVDAAAEAVAVCARHGAPVLSRGGGTSLGGQCTNAAVVIDWTKYCNHLVSLDAERRVCVVEPGIVLDELNRQLADAGLMFGPKPATHSQCTLGGMIGNNSCGASAQAYGKTADNVRRLEIVTYDGLRCWVGPTPPEELDAVVAAGGRRGTLYAELRALVDRHLADLRTGYPELPRRVSGYNLDDLLPERGFHLARALVGSEGTMVAVLRAELDLVPVPPAESMLVLGYDDICAAADAVPRMLEHSSPHLLEALDGRMAQLMREEGVHLESLDTFPEGESWLLVQFAGDTRDDVDRQANDLLHAIGRAPDDPTVAFSDNPAREVRALKAREAGLGVTARPPDGRDTWEGWEDSAVPPDRLGDYLRDLKGLFAEFGLDHPTLYGHFGHGCVHTRIPFELRTPEGVVAFRAFLGRAADLVTSYGGSLSGEHGDGQARGELLERMYGPGLLAAFREAKALFDPGDHMNPGKVVAPHRVDEDLRLGPWWRPREPAATAFDYPHDDHSFTRAVTRCIGIGNCRSHEGGVMCPSYRATGEEEHSTRGRARLLFEMLGGQADSTVTQGWRSPEVRDALDLCLACKGCRSDCPTGVDMATYKAEFLSHHYAGRLRPAAHYSMGWLPLWAHLASAAPEVVNALLYAPGLAAAGKRLAGVAPERDAPVFAARPFLTWWAESGRTRPDPGDPRTVLLWPDTFTNHFHPHVAQAAVRVLESAGFHVAVPDRPVCCGLTWISTGQLRTAKRVLRRTADALAPWLDAGTTVVGLEPSCTAVFRADAPELLPGDDRVRRLADQVRTLAEVLTGDEADGWRPPHIGRAATVQTHCHQHAVMKFDADRELMRRAGLDADVLDVGCCGLAGNFGFERGHHALSLEIADLGLLDAVRRTDPDAFVIADGFSCRTQISQADTGRTAMHLAEALERGMDGGPADGGLPEQRLPRPVPPARRARLLATAAGGGALVAAALAALSGRRTGRGVRELTRYVDGFEVPEG
ncbi:FAD-binding and (Fe-S)-binding domain-containing protein [Yinghuangia seranimata]|uniref:FAD-binding and (Fe-S)-binding domain-containing protein n=1 Tax=Yinghuangia seranimata TaxID=408067 RepID=UPI00248C6E71|nr:FAD-binding and (Fe-S)-binding domain-containing protein [Yinghuangia seranimata]MDI2125492.1 FAD-linked oxidase C-terminal domain-containing protein [Yinghuangia seranimata]